MGLRGGPVRLYCLRLGTETLPESVSLRGGSPEYRLTLPVTGAAVEFADGTWVLLDTGFNPTILRDPELRARHFVLPGYLPEIPPGDALLDQIACAGLSLRF